MKEETNGLSQAGPFILALRALFVLAVVLLALRGVSGASGRAQAAWKAVSLGSDEGAVASAVQSSETMKTKTLIPVGQTVGIKLFADGVMIVGLSEVIGESGASCPAKASGLKEGDIVTHIDGIKIGSSEQFRSVIQDLGGEPMTLQIVRNGTQMQLEATAVLAAGESVYRLGAWTRDSMAGIGTVTFYDPESGTFGALGHGINDVDTMMLVPLASGSIMPASVAQVVKGQSGTPGELRGQFDVTTDLGLLYSNTESGVYGTMLDDSWIKNQEALEVARANEVKVGKATILSNVSGDTVEEYEIEITRVFPAANGNGRNMMIKVTDQRLLEQTGGIVQGMSGSPILQNGKIIGAVTHVLINNPTEGYGIFIEQMMEEAGNYNWNNMEIAS